MSEAHDISAAPPPPRALQRGRVVQEFARLAAEADTVVGLRRHLCDAIGALGFDHVLLQDASGAVWLAEMPAAWRPATEATSDAVLAAAQLSFAPFLWPQIERIANLSEAQEDFLAQAVAAGIGAGITVPIHRPRDGKIGGPIPLAGLCSFLMKNGRLLPLETLAAAHYIGALAFDAAEALQRAEPAAIRPGMPRLTPRQNDCVVLVAQGKSDWEIGRLLGISESTVHKHIEDAKRRFKVSTRIQLVVRSLADARLSFQDAIG
jgi:LuxR family quorum-sensing system transcriptional regulator CciR